MIVHVELQGETPRMLQSIGYDVPSGIRPRAPLISLLFHCFIALAWISVAPRIPFVMPRILGPLSFDPAKSDITIYYIRESLPEISDLSGAQSGESGRLKSDEYFHTRQVIRIAHGRRVVPAVVDAPTLHLPQVKAPANLLQFPGVLPIAPSSTVARSAVTTRTLPTPVVIPPLPASSMPFLTRKWSAPEPVVAPPPPEAHAVVDRPRLEVPVAEVVAPPPEVSAVNRQISSLSGADYAVAPRPLAAPPDDASNGSGGSATAAGGAGGKDIAVIIAANPGQQIGAGPGISGALAMSHSGKAGGTGGEGGQNTVTGRLETATGSGSGNIGDGLGSDSSARGGLSPRPGTGGAGSGNSMAPTLAAGAMISNGQYYIPSFAASAAPASHVKAQSLAAARLPAMVVVATPNSGTALVSSLRGRRIYTLYLDTTIGSVVFQFADNTAQQQGFERELTAPAPIVANFPPDLRVLRTTIHCVLDRTGKLRNLAVDSTSSPDLMPQIFDVLRTWLFRPALKGEDPVEVIAAIGIDLSRH